jgi:hypothetical protein
MAGRRKFVIDNPLPGYRLSFIFVKDFFLPEMQKSAISLKPL